MSTASLTSKPYLLPYQPLTQTYLPIYLKPSTRLTIQQAELQHTKTNVAPMPEIEKGEALDGMNASGGGDAPKAGHTGQGKGADSNKPAPVDQVTK